VHCDSEQRPNSASTGPQRRERPRPKTSLPPLSRACHHDHSSTDLALQFFTTRSRLDATTASISEQAIFFLPFRHTAALESRSIGI
jgi:hypothetical protein